MKTDYSLQKTEKPKKTLYFREELQALTTLQLREICSREKIVAGAVYRLNREYLIDLIFKYRGAEHSYFIDGYNEEGISKLTTKKMKYAKFIQADKEYKIAARVVLYLDIDLEERDGCKVSGNDMQEGNAFLLNENNQLCGLFNIKKTADNFFLTCRHEFLSPELKEAVYKNYSIGFLNLQESDSLYRYYTGMEALKPRFFPCFLKKVPELVISKTQASSSTLVIDLGASNTSAGVYLDKKMQPLKTKEKLGIGEIQLIKFETLDPESPYSETVPTVISVKNCQDGTQFSYRFGYDAKKHAINNCYMGRESVFYGIKSWVNHYEKTEEIYDEQANTAYLPRTELIYQYLKFIIFSAERQNKCRYKKIHITSPVKQKQQFLDLYEAVLGREYEISREMALDESIAVLYNSISKRIENQDFNNGEVSYALVMDCGGGTTDLSSCKYDISDHQFTYGLNLTTTYTNGDSSFGGNHLTYRIMQYLKIAFTTFYRDKKVISVVDIISIDSSDIYRFVDSEGVRKIYEGLDDWYLKCEDYMPTQFASKKEYEAEEYSKIKSNFYFLWNLAEKIKIDFYKKRGIAYTKFHIQGLCQDEKGNKMIAEESWRINVYEPNGQGIETLMLHTDFPNVFLTKKEIDLLLLPDIYNIIKKLLEPLYLDGSLEEYSYIKLTGQTCKIDLFRETLKEYIPGKLIETAGEEKEEKYYKLTCVEGALKYENAKKIGKIAPVLKDEAPVTPYLLTAYTYNQREIMLISSFESVTKTYGCISRNIDTEYIDLTLKDHEEKILHVYRLYLTDFCRTSYEETGIEYAGKIPQDDIDSIEDNEIKIFIFSDHNIWGFYTLPIERKDGELFLASKKYFPFESSEWIMDFYDGRK